MVLVFFHKHRLYRVGGGVGLYLSENYDSRIRGELCFENEEIAESLFIEINNSIGKNIIVWVIYRPHRPLSHILNLSIASGIVPDDMKIACVIPLFQAGDRSVFSNYRPVSILPCFSKFLERAMYNRLLAYIIS
jgi:hypothetical protein